MNKKAVIHSLGQIMFAEAIVLTIPLITSLICADGQYFSYIIPIATLIVVGLLFTQLTKGENKIGAKEGFVIVGLSWITLGLFGSIPYMISGAIPNFVNAFFETVSGYTTTGATILHGDEINNYTETIPSIMLYRSLTHFAGGMGILVFVLAILPKSEGNNIYILRAEATGPQVGKLVSKMKITARILYIIYVALTALETILLAISPSMTFFEALNHSFSTAGTGGFGLYSDSCAHFSSYCQVIISVFMMIFGINFNIFYLIIIGKVSKALKSEELWTYIGIMAVSTIIVTINIFFGAASISGSSFGSALRVGFFETSSFMTSTGLTNASYLDWPALSKVILFFCMFIGSCAGSTGGGIKVARICILVKSAKREMTHLIHPKRLTHIKYEGTILEESVSKNVLSYFTTIIILFVLCSVVISIDGFDIETNLSAVASCINNVGIAFGHVAEVGNFNDFSYFSKIVLSFAMLIGRLEIYPILLLFNYKTWINR